MTSTYEVRTVYGRLSAKRFRDAVARLKDMGGKFDPASKAWTLTADDAGVFQGSRGRVAATVHDLDSLAAAYDLEVTRG